MKIYYCDEQIGDVVEFDSLRDGNIENPHSVKPVDITNAYCRHVEAPPYEYVGDSIILKDGTIIIEVEDDDLSGYFAYGPSAKNHLEERCRWWNEEPWEDEIVSNQKGLADPPGPQGKDGDPGLDQESRRNGAHAPK